jgi:hypothetical protein
MTTQRLAHGWPVWTSHSRIVLSALPEARRLPSGLNASLDTSSVCPWSGERRVWPVSTSHSLTVRSALPDAIVLPSGLKATADIRAVWPLRGCPTTCPLPIPKAHGLVQAAGRYDPAVGLNATLVIESP